MKYALVGLILIVFAILILLALQFTGSVTNRLPAILTPAPSITTSVPQVTGSQEMQQVSLFFVALEDDGKSGQKIGCSDSLVEVKKEIPQTSEILEATLRELLSIKEQYYGQSGLYNGLSQSSLIVEKVELEGEVANVYLTGNLSLGGVCDSPRVEEQLKATALQFPTIRSVNFYVNNTPLTEALSQK